MANESSSKPAKYKFMRTILQDQTLCWVSINCLLFCQNYEHRIKTLKCWSLNLSSPSGLWCYKTPWKASRLSADIIEPANQILGITYTMKGTENIDKKKAYVVVCNHQSSLDVLATMQVKQKIGKFKMIIYYRQRQHVDGALQQKEMNNRIGRLSDST